MPLNARLFVWFRLLFNCRFYYPVYTILFLDFGLDFFTRPADALLADFADIIVARLSRFRAFGAGLRELYHDELAIAAVLGVELHNGVGGRGRAGEEIQRKRVLICSKEKHLFYVIDWLWKVKEFLVIKYRLYFPCSRLVVTDLITQPNRVWGTPILHVTQKTFFPRERITIFSKPNTIFCNECI